MIQIILAAFALVFATFASAELPSEATRTKIIERMVSEIERIDGEGLLPRNSRPESWKSTIQRLKQEAAAATTTQDFGRVLRRLDATYPNLHARIVLAPEFELLDRAKQPEISVRFRPEIIKQGQKAFVYKVASINSEMIAALKENERPAISDLVVAINGRPMTDLSRENFVFCKFPYREQCENNIFDNFRKELLGWKLSDQLEYSLERNGRRWTVKIPVGRPKVAASTESAQPECVVDPNRYEGFLPTYKGQNACAFESTDHPGVVVLRILGSGYGRLPEDSKIRSLADEVEQFYQTYWRDRAPGTKKLIIDVIDNGGGNSPVDWYRIFYRKPFQEQYVSFKKLKELDNPEIRKDLFYGDVGKEIWFAELLKSAQYEKTKYGEFLPPVPQFCVSQDKNCADGLFNLREHGFKGQVRILTNEWCISSCTGFMWSMKDQLNAKVFGVPDSGDSGYARLFIDIYLDPKSPDGFRLEVAGRKGGSRQELPAGALLRQQVSATRSTDGEGKLLSAKPTRVDHWIAPRYRHFDDSWENEALQAALND